jgi:hypothetical protein
MGSEKPPGLTSSRLCDQRENVRANGMFIANLSNSFEKPPAFGLTNSLAGLQRDQRAQGLQFQKLRIREQFKIATKIGILRFR